MILPETGSPTSDPLRRSCRPNRVFRKKNQIPVALVKRGLDHPDAICRPNPTDSLEVLTPRQSSSPRDEDRRAKAVARHARHEGSNACQPVEHNNRSTGSLETVYRLLTRSRSGKISCLRGPFARDWVSDVFPNRTAQCHRTQDYRTK